MRIESTANERVKGVRRLHRTHERHRTGRTLVEGPHLVEAALDAGIVPEELYGVDRTAVVERCQSSGSTFYEVAPRILEVVATTLEPQGPIGVVEIPANRPLESARTVVAVEIGDPGNLGTLIRTAAAFGWQMARIGGADPWSPKVIRASAGAQFGRPAIAVAALEDFVGAGLILVAAVAVGGMSPTELDVEQPIALLVGNETRGLPVGSVEKCHAAVTIPMTDATQSLNVAVAGAVTMYALS